MAADVLAAVGVGQSRSPRPRRRWLTTLIYNLRMSKMLRKKIAKVSDQFFLPGEQLVDAITAQPVGGFKKQVGGAQLGIIGAVVSHKLAEKAQDKIGAESVAPLTPFPPVGLVALTDQRLVVFKQSAMTGKPNEILAEYSRGSIAGMTYEKKKVTSNVTLSFIDGTSVTFETINVAKPDEFVDSFNA